MNRRGFLKLLGGGALVTVVAPGLVLPEPERRYWQVGRNAPVGGLTLFSDGIVQPWEPHGLESGVALRLYQEQWDARARELAAMYERYAHEVALNLARYGNVRISTPLSSERI